MWTLEEGSRQSNLIMAKAKLCPLHYKSETTRSELAAATYASRLKCWISKKS